MVKVRNILIQKADGSYKIMEAKAITDWTYWTKERTSNMLGNKIAAFTSSFGKGIEIVFEIKGSVPQYVKDYISGKAGEGYNVMLKEVI